jgi:hypothetical protein
MILSHDPDFFDLLVSSYRRAVGREPPFLQHGAPRSAEWLYAQASHPVLAHNTDPDPRFIYANRAAQTAFEYDWDEITALHRGSQPSLSIARSGRGCSTVSPAMASPPAIRGCASPSPAGAF